MSPDFACALQRDLHLRSTSVRCKVLDFESLVMFIFVLGLSLAMTACGGASSGAAAGSATGGEMQTLNGLQVPPEPDPATNGATLQGVDVNSNGVRDDVERKLAAEANSSAELEKLVKYAQANQRLITMPTPRDRSAALAEMSKVICAIDLSVPAIGKLNVLQLLANDERRSSAWKAFGDVLGALDSSELQTCNQ